MNRRQRSLILTRAEAMNELRLRVLGAPVSVFFEAGVGVDIALELRNAWSRCLEPQPAHQEPVKRVLEPRRAEGGNRKYVARVITSLGTSDIVAATSEQQFSSLLTSVITVSGIGVRAGELMMLHASGLAHPVTGKTAALVGRSGMGKTTATKILGTDFGYITDETVAVDRSGRIVPYAKPLSLMVDGPAAPKRQLGPDELGLGIAPTTATLSAIVLLDRDPNAGEPKVLALNHADAVLELIPQTSSLARISRPLQWLCSLLDACGGAVRVTYREAQELLPLLPDLLERPMASERWVPAVEEVPCPEEFKDLAPGMLHRAQVVDAVELPGGTDGPELLVMVEQRVIRLVGIAPAIWRAVRTPARTDLIADRMAEEVTLPEGYEKSLGEAVRDLEAHGLLIRT